MRFSFDLSDTLLEEPSKRFLTPKEEVEWVPLQKHPFFTSSTTDIGAIGAAGASDVSLAPRNLLAWDGSSRLYYWDTNKQCLLRISIRLGEPEPTSVIAASPSKELRPEVQVNFVVERISINRRGSAMIVAGSDGLYVMYLYGRNSNKGDAIVCRCVSVGPQHYLNGTNTVRVLQVSWHPYSDTHVGVLSSDSVFRLFDLSSNVMQPEQEFYLQPVEPGRSKKAASLCPVNFCFGGDHLWDRFSVFILFSDGSIYILCPVVPFGSVYKWDSVVEIYGDAQAYGLKSANSKAVHNSSIAISWLEATFPELAEVAERANLATVKAHPHALFDASLSLQGPLRRVCETKEDVATRGAECEGGAVSLFYNLAGKDSIIVVGWSGGQLQIDALADEIQPLWNMGSPPRVCVDSSDRIIGLAMICESSAFLEEDSLLRISDQGMEVSVWLGRPPPLLRLAIVDLALPEKANVGVGGASIQVFPDPLIPERMYCLHDGGIDSIVLHFLPFTSQSNGKDDAMRTPSVHPVLSTFLSSSSSSLCGSVALSDSFGYSWIVGVIPNKECVVIGMRSWDILLPPVVTVIESAEEVCGTDEMEEVPNMMISKELLHGPKVVVIPQSPSSLGSVSADSIEGRSILHQYFNLFHENYVEYAHKVYFEAKHNAGQLKRIIGEQQKRLGEAQERLLRVEKKQSGLDERMDDIIHKQKLVDQRMRRLCNLPAAHNKPLSRAERDLKAQLDQFVGVELDALHSSVEALKARLRRVTTKHSPFIMKKRSSQHLPISIQDQELSLLKSSLEKLSLVNSDNLSKVNLVDSAIKTREDYDNSN